MRILCYGDSNTWGYVPNINGYSKDAVMKQYEEKDCWWYPLMQGNEVFVNGLCGRCIAHENKWLKNRNASETILNDLKDYKDIELIIVQLGTNDCKSEYGDSALTITQNLDRLLKLIQSQTTAQVIVISPAIIQENNKITQKYYVGAQEKSLELDSLYKNMAKKNNYGFISGKPLEIGEDGEHLTKSGHKQLGVMVSSLVKSLDKETCM